MHQQVFNKALSQGNKGAWQALQLRESAAKHYKDGLNENDMPDKNWVDLTCKQPAGKTESSL